MKSENYEEDSHNKLNYLDVIYGVIFNPLNTFKKVIAKGNLKWSLLTYLFVNIFVFSVKADAVISSGYKFFPAGIVNSFKQFILFYGLVGLMLNLLLLFIISGLLSLTAQFFGGKGDGKSLLIAGGFVTIPLVFYYLVFFIYQAVKLNFLILVAIRIITFLWIVYLVIQAVKVSQDINIVKSVLVVFLPFFILITMIIITVIALFFIFSQLFQQLPLNFP